MNGSTSEVSDDVLHHSQPLKLELVPTENEFSDTAELQISRRPRPAHLSSASRGGLKSFGGYHPGQPNAQTFTVPDYPKLLHFMADGSLLSLSGDKHVSVVSRNVPGMKLEIGRVLPDQIAASGELQRRHLCQSRSERRFQRRSYRRAVRGDARVSPWRAPARRITKASISAQYLKAGKHGVFLLHLSSYDPSKKKAADASSDDLSSDDSPATTPPAIPATTRRRPRTRGSSSSPISVSWPSARWTAAGMSSCSRSTRAARRRARASPSSRSTARRSIPKRARPTAKCISRP